MNSTDFVRIAEEINLDCAYIRHMVSFIENHQNIIALLDKEEELIRVKLSVGIDAYNGFFEQAVPGDLLKEVNLYFSLILAKRCRQEYRERGIDSKIFRSTMGDINIWAKTCERRTGRIGLNEMGWIRNHLSLRLFRLGRLQFERSRLERDFRAFPVGTPALRVHIPEGEKLDTGECRDSLARAGGFFAEKFSESYPIATCHSWLLHESLGELMPPDSNIIRFAGLFEIVECDNDNSQAIERVFGYARKVTPELPEMTSLQRKMKRHLLEGHSLGMGLGFILI